MRVECSLGEQEMFVFMLNSGTQQPSSFLFPNTLSLGEQKHKKLFVMTFDAQSILPQAEFRCYEAKMEESEKGGSRQESNPGHLWLEPPVLCH